MALEWETVRSVHPTRLNDAAAFPLERAVVTACLDATERPSDALFSSAFNHTVAALEHGGFPNPLPADLHVVVIANESRVNFTVPSSREIVTYALQRIRALI